MSELKPLIFPADASLPRHQPPAFPFATAAQAQLSPNNLVENRMQQLEQMLQEAQGRAEIVEKEAYDKAYLAGEKAGMALGRKRGEQILEALQTSLKGAESDITALRTSFADAAIDVARHIAEQIIGRALEQNDDSLFAIARQTAAQLPDTSNLHIAVAASDYITFKRMLDDDASTMALSSDASVLPGTCRIISANQDILIDPVAAVSNYLSHLQPLLFEPVTPPADPDPGQDE
ncbi:MAG: flagellar assembly protein [Zetaproteobacteria bacterium CG12_big_fil_rev_8_21_14_0_65_54_13]|nr:MAG: flagellar assembly protein [Zetaproteobacteria bacterium CG23_combo_of_CG06-09_8_20_14_all_54_7]PIW51225.1 MAG: flagellar assembly protein [Zetaproteobacteria bacterium CG12_big_fil_rev_8_21_14_0_65_54_13]PIX53523.1 MAG: flagellar assembly protein [Zetaproteobacteria bacterium CG_4_10_14_3_um_filter_54_28]PJA28333.1 MAG: flagellar assembly protein [Zetaproteobacteria bacterium CG_4_9_14_3_um_filter_54_145]